MKTVLFTTRKKKKIVKLNVLQCSDEIPTKTILWGLKKWDFFLIIFH